MAVRIQNTSRLKLYDLVTVGEAEFWDFDPLPELPIFPDDRYYQVQDGDRIDTLAFRFYGDVRYWWVLAVANGYELLPTQLNVGDKIRVPSVTYVQQQVLIPSPQRRL